MSSFWQIEIPIIVRNLINDMTYPPTYSDARIEQLILVAAQYVLMDVDFTRDYTVNVLTSDISPDPSAPNIRDIDFIGLTAMRAACMLDQSTFRTRAAVEGIRSALGPASLAVTGSLGGYKDILNLGPCKIYEQLVLDYNIGNATAARAVLSPFVGNNFDPRNVGGGEDGSDMPMDDAAPGDSFF